MITLPGFIGPAINKQTGGFAPEWARYLQDVHRVIGGDDPSATDTSAGTVKRAVNVPSPTGTVATAPAAYNQAWGDEVVSLLEEIRDNQTAILTALKNSGAMDVS